MMTQTIFNRSRQARRGLPIMPATLPAATLADVLIGKCFTVTMTNGISDFGPDLYFNTLDQAAEYIAGEVVKNGHTVLIPHASLIAAIKTTMGQQDPTQPSWRWQIIPPLDASRWMPITRGS